MWLPVAKTSRLASSSLDGKGVVLLGWSKLGSWPPILCLLCSVKNLENCFFEQDPRIAGVATAHGEVDVLVESGLHHVAGNVGCSSQHEEYVVQQSKHQGIVYYAVYEVDELGVAPEHGGEGVVVAAVHNNLAG